MERTIVDTLRVNQHTFPYKRLYRSETDVGVSFGRLIEAISLRNLEDGVDVTPFIREKGMERLTYKGKGCISFTRREEEYHTSEWLTDYFTEVSRMRAYRSERGGKLSPYEAWYSYGEYVTNGVRECLKSFPPEGMKERLKSFPREDPLSGEVLHALREGLYLAGGVEECANESPIFLGLLYRFLGCGCGVGKIFDATAGWGDRMLAAIALGVEKYVGIDPNTNSTAGFYEMVEVLGTRRFPEEEDIHSRYHVFPWSMPCDVFPEEDGTYTIGFISPPSYDTEIYSQDIGQSTNTFLHKSTWLEHFLEKTIDLTINKVKLGGYLVLQSILIEEIAPYIRWKYPNLTFMGPVSVGVAPTPQKPHPRYKPMWIWRKDEGDGTPPSREFYKDYLLHSLFELKRCIDQEDNHIPFLSERNLTLEIVPGCMLSEDVMGDVGRLREEVWKECSPRLSFSPREKWITKEDYEAMMILVRDESSRIVASSRLRFFNEIRSIPSARWLMKGKCPFEGGASAIEKLVVDEGYRYRDGIPFSGGMGRMLDTLAIAISKLTSARWVYCDVPPRRIRTLETMGFSREAFHSKKSKTSNTPDVVWTGMVLDLEKGI